MIIGIYLYLFRQVLQSIIIITFDCKKRLEVVSYYIRIKFQERPNLNIITQQKDCFFY